MKPFETFELKVTCSGFEFFKDHAGFYVESRLSGLREEAEGQGGGYWLLQNPDELIPLGLGYSIRNGKKCDGFKLHFRVELTGLLL